jgi:formate-dependent nitrite reductase membrane component NrfD
VGAVFLVHDLGRPSRFLNMVRVFRPTSPMNMGSWILGGAAPTAIATGLFINRGGILGAVGEVTGYFSGIFGTALAGYTGVLVSNSVIPVWQESRRWMPILFAASAMTAAASILDILHENERANRITYTFGNIGRVLELAASYKVEESASRVAKVGEPFHRPGAGTLWKAAGVLTAASLLISAMPGKSSGKRKVAGVLGAAGSLCLRFAVHYISNASARDPRASFQVQRRQLKEARDGG